jgi:hypothetical protein
MTRSGEDHIYLVSRTTFSDYLDFMGSWPVDAASLDKKKLADDWRATDEVMQKLRRTEAGWADNPAIRPVDAALEPLVENVYADPIFQQAFTEVPSEIGIVELDRLVVCQKLVSRAHFDRLKKQLGKNHAPEAVFRFALPYDHPLPDHRIGRISDHEFAFMSESNDLRFLDSLVLKPEQVSDYRPVGPIAGIVALVVGYGSNYLNVISTEGRLLLNNGNHRACTLRYMGITHVPCVIQKVSNREELEVLAPGSIRRNVDYYLQQPRPPVLKDYFDPRLTKILPLAMSSRQVRISYDVEQLDMP